MVERHCCAAWDGHQCKAHTNLMACVFAITQGNYLKGPDKVVVHLCPKHFKLDLPNKKKVSIVAEAKQ